MKTERVQKVLSQVGLASRRAIEAWIAQGLVAVNGQIVALGAKVTPMDTISVKGQRIQRSQVFQTRILLYHKPVGEICSRNDPKFTQTIFDHLPKLKTGRWVQVGRLDLNTSGLLVLTNNGDLANQLMHPRYALEREYAVRVRGSVNQAMIRRLKQGVRLEDGPAKFVQITPKGGEGVNAWYHVVLTEGRQREVRRLWASQGIEVSRLIRIRYGTLVLPRYVSRGQYSELSPEAVQVFLRREC